MSTTDSAIVFVSNDNLTNNGFISHAGLLYVEGDLINEDTLDCANTLTNFIQVGQNWTNNKWFNSGLGLVSFPQGNQLIQGYQTSSFQRLNLAGAVNDIKTISIDTEVKDSLFLNNVRFELATNNLSLPNAEIEVQRNTGYIAMDYKGKVNAVINGATSDITFPLGYSNANNGHRPITLRSPQNGSYGVALYGNSPGDNAKSVTSLQDSLCSIQDEYYYWLQSGNSNADFYVTLKGETKYTKMSVWQSGQWGKLTNSRPNGSKMGGMLSANQARYISLGQERPFVDAGDDIVMRRGNTANFNGSGYKPAFTSIDWTPSEDLSCIDCYDPVFTYGSQGTFTMSIDNGQGCIATDTMRLVYWREKVFVENAFSPNDDGLNDVFSPKLLSNERLINMQVFNKWGAKIYEGTEGWDGKYMGGVVQEGVYVYVLTIDQLLLDGVKHIVNTKGTIAIIP